jgi:hypothetical protein
MKTITFASSLVVLSALACAAPGQPAAADTTEMQDIRWDVTPEAGKAAQPKLQLRHKRTNSDVSLDAELAGRRPEFAAVRSALGRSGPVHFTVKHAAGTLDCRGHVTRPYDGNGQCSFAPDAGFGRALDERGLALGEPADQLTMLMVDATIELADGLIREAVPPKEADDLIAAAALDVTPAYVRDIKSEAILLTDIDDAIACKALGVDGAYVRGLAAAGYRKLSAEDVVGMKALGVTGEYARAMNRAAGGNVK